MLPCDLVLRVQKSIVGEAVGHRQFSSSDGPKKKNLNRAALDYILSHASFLFKNIIYHYKILVKMKVKVSFLFYFYDYVKLGFTN